MKYLMLIAMVPAMILLINGCAKSTKPTTKSILIEETTYETVGRPYDMIVTDDYVFLAEDQAGYSIFSRPSGNLIRRINKRDETAYYANARQLAYLEGEDILVVFDRWSGARLRFYDISDPSEPAFLHHYQGAGIDRTQYMELFRTPQDNIILVIAYSNSSLRVYSASMAYPFVENYNDFPTPNNINTFVIDDEYLYFSASQRGLYIFEYTTEMVFGFLETQAKLLSECNMTGEALDIAVKGNYAYVAARHQGLLVADISDRTAPEWLKDNGYETSGWAQSVAVEGDYLVVGSGGGGVYLFDISKTPERPHLLDKKGLSYTDYVYLVEIHNGEVFTAGRDKGITKFSINR